MRLYYQLLLLLLDWSDMFTFMFNNNTLFLTDKYQRFFIINNTTQTQPWFYYLRCIEWYTQQDTSVYIFVNKHMLYAHYRDPGCTQIMGLFILTM